MPGKAYPSGREPQPHLVNGALRKALDYATLIMLRSHGMVWSVHTIASCSSFNKPSERAVE
jgi:hypothetical protein